jgi:ribokinase
MESFVSSYGAGDSFAGALTWYIANFPDASWVGGACALAAAHGAAVLRGIDPIASQTHLNPAPHDLFTE